MARREQGMLEDVATGISARGLGSSPSLTVDTNINQPPRRITFAAARVYR